VCGLTGPVFWLISAALLSARVKSLVLPRLRFASPVGAQSQQKVKTRLQTSRAPIEISVTPPRSSRKLPSRSATREQLLPPSRSSAREPLLASSTSPPGQLRLVRSRGRRPLPARATPTPPLRPPSSPIRPADSGSTPASDGSLPLLPRRRTADHPLLPCGLRRWIPAPPTAAASPPVDAVPCSPGRQRLAADGIP
jgi:hypothetical protein